MDIKTAIRNDMIKKDLERWSAHTRNAFLSNSGSGAHVYASYLHYTMRGDFDLLNLFVDPLKVCVDVGTNNGQYALKLSAISKACLCIEPLKMYSHLGEILPDNCIFRNVAAGSSMGTDIIRVPMQNGQAICGASTMAPDNLLTGYECKEQTTEVRTVDELVQDVFSSEKVGFIKIDVEGFEYEVIKGSTETLTSHRPNIQIELHGKMEPLFTLLVDIGYRPLFFFKGQLFDISQFDHLIHRAPENEWWHRNKHGLEFDPELYVCDFYFIPVIK